MSSWLNVSHVEDGEAVKATVAGRPSRALEARTAWLRDRLNEASLGQALFTYGVTLDPALVVGQPVYYNRTTLRYEPALAAAETSSAGVLVAKDTADVLGIVYSKTNDTLGDILNLGYAQVSGVSAAVVGGNAVPGRYCLSSAEPGMLINQSERPAPLVPVLYLFPDDYVYVAPYVKDFVEEHVHYRYELGCRPAGVHVPASANDGRHTMTDTDADIAGWLPANHPSFNGLAPANAVFGYNLAADSELSAVWPPVPIEAAQLLFDKDGDGAKEVPLGAWDLATIDDNGIWWNSDCENDVPWPADFTGPTSLGASSSSQGAECPRLKRMRMYIAFARMTYLTTPNVVTQLTNVTGSPLQILNGAGQPASRGSLFLHYSDALAARTYPLQIGKLDNAAETYLSNVLYYNFPAGQSSTLWGRVTVPDRNLPLLPRLRLQLRILGRSSGTLPQLEVSYRRLPQPVVGGAAQALSVSAQDLTIVTTGSITADRYILAESDAFEVSAGDEVEFEIHRANDDSYGGALGLVSLKAVLTGV